MTWTNSGSCSDSANADGCRAPGEVYGDGMTSSFDQMVVCTDCDDCHASWDDVSEAVGTAIGLYIAIVIAILVAFICIPILLCFCMGFACFASGAAGAKAGQNRAQENDAVNAV